MFGTGILPSTAGADIVTAITGAISSDIAPVLVVLGFVVGLRVVFKLLNRSTKGKL